MLEFNLFGLPLTINYIQFFLQLVPETFITILCGYAFQKKAIDKVYVLSGALLSVFVFIVSFLPIGKELKSILSFVIAALILIAVSKITMTKAIISAFFMFVLFIAVEGFNVLIVLEKVLGLERDYINKLVEPYTIETWLYGLPDFIIKVTVVLVLYLSRLKIGMGRKKNVPVE